MRLLDRQGNTPIYVAAQEGHKELRELLLGFNRVSAADVLLFRYSRTQICLVCRSNLISPQGSQLSIWRNELLIILQKTVDTVYLPKLNRKQLFMITLSSVVPSKLSKMFIVNTI